MGRRDRERITRINAGQEEPIARVRKVAGNLAGRKILAVTSRKGVIAELSKGSTTEQVGRLDDLVGTGNLPERKLKDAIMRKAPKEMDKVIRKFRGKGKEITVDSLCTEVKSTPGFLVMCEKVGLNLEWFEKLATDRMKANGVQNGK